MTNENQSGEPKPLDPEQAKIQAQADLDRRGLRSDPFDKAQQHLDQSLLELQTLLEARTLKGGLTSIDVQCDTMDDEPMVGLEGWGSYRQYEKANVDFLRAHREHTKGRPTNSGSIEFASQEDRVMWHLAELPTGKPTKDGVPRPTKPAIIRWSYNDQRWEYNSDGEVAVWPEFDENGKPHKSAGEKVVMWRLQEIRKIQDDASDEISSALLDVRRAQSRVRKERKADFTTGSVETPGDMSEVSF